MQAIKVERENAAAFIAYCRKYSGEHDDSYTGAEDLDEETLKNTDNPSYLLQEEGGETIGAASLMLGGFKEIRKGRMRIFHCVKPEEEQYRMLFNEILKHTAGIDDIYLFLPEQRKAEGEMMRKLGFSEWRRSYVLTRKAEGCGEAVFPDGFILQEFVQGRDEETWCNIMNTCFAHLAGHTDMTPDAMRGYFTSEGHLPGGLKLLWKDGEAMGAVHTAMENEGVAFIEQVAVLPKYQRLGLGRQLLRAGMAKAIEAGLGTIGLSVNGENEKAVALYLDEGFAIMECLVCYNRALRG